MIDLLEKRFVDRACQQDLVRALSRGVLIQLDRALRSGDAAAARTAVERLEAQEPGLISNLRRAAAGGDVATTVARFYPY